MEIPKEIYRKLFDTIIDCAIYHDIEGINDTIFDFDFVEGEFKIYGKAVLPVDYVDDSYDHEFGTFNCGHYEHDLSYFPEIKEIEAYYNQEKLDFDFNLFDSIFHVSEIEIKGQKLKSGDRVYVKLYSQYRRAIFKYFDTRSKRYYCCPTVEDYSFKYPWSFKKIYLIKP